jgi:hypothetical protein
MFIEMKRHFAVRSLEWFSAAYLFSWGSYVALHPGLFDGPRLSVVFRPMLQWADQATWGYCATMVATIHLVGLFINGRWGVTPWIRCATSVLSVGAWFCISVGVLYAAPNTGIAIYPGLLLADVFSAFRAASDAAEARVNTLLAKKLQEAGGVSNVAKFARRG